MRHRAGRRAAARVLVVVAAAVALAGCAGESSSPGSTAGPARYGIDGTDGTDVDGGTDGTDAADGPPVTVASGTSAAAAGIAVDGACPQPWLPVYAGGSVYNGTEPADWPDEVPPPEGPSIDLASRSSEPPDTDGDGVPDVVSTSAEGAAVLLERGDGPLVLVTAGIVGFPGGRTWVGDLDGDGRDDLVVYVSPFSADARSEDVLVVVPGSVPTGTHDPREVGVVLTETTAPAGLVTGVGDQDGDGADDVWWDGVVVPGPALLAPGPGGRVTERPVLGVLPDDTVALLDLAPGFPPVAVSAAVVASGDAVELTVHTEPAVVLRTDRIPWPGGTVAPGSVTGRIADGHPVVTLTADEGRSGVVRVWSWDLAAPCAGPTPA